VLARASTTRRRLILADDHAVILDGLQQLLQGTFDIVARVDSGEALLVAVDEHRPDVVVTDISMPGLNGLVATQKIRARHPDICVFILSMHPEAEYVVSALEAGAAGYVLKHAGGADLIAAIRRGLAGQTYVPPELADEVSRLMRTSKSRGTPQLSERQIDVLRLLALGKTAKEIASSLDISRKTVEYHKYRMQAILGANSTVDLVRRAIDRGFVDS
jgi:DNA-binding NarL/FixJ family response regulator